jgi:hypothetical protein
LRGEINKNITGSPPWVMHICTKTVLMKRYLLAIIALSAAFYATGKQKPAVKRPKLVVGIVVDQMRWDYLYRFNSLYGRGGFKRLMADGFNCQNTMINYLPSYTAPGHSCVYTGSVPSIHGIAANDWYDATTGKTVYCTDDSSVQEVNSGKTGGRSMSPRNLQVTTVTDELRLATNFGSRVYGVAIKDRGSILPAGHLANGAYWLDDSTGSFCTSTYYKNTSPAWLAAFNKRHVADSLIKTGWNLVDPTKQLYTQSLTDDNRYEGKFKGEAAPVFPHSVAGLGAKDKYNGFKAMPGGNYLTLQMAMACRDGERLGEGDATDLLAISLSCTDYAGHQFGPNSIEVEDMYLQLDAQLAELLAYLDKSVGKGNYTLFLSADHGAAHNPQFLQDNGVPAGFLSTDYKKEVNNYLAGIYKQQNLVKRYTNYQLYVNDSAIKAYGLDKSKVKASILEYLGTREELAYAADLDNMNATPLPEPIRTMVVNGYYRGRSGSIQMIPNPGWFEGHSKTGTTHGTWNPYDTHIPLLWYGWGIPKGETYNVVNMTDISATLAALLHIQMPNGCVGKPIVEIMKGN